MKYTSTIEIPKAEAKAHQKFLDKSYKDYEKNEECERTEDTIATYSTVFKNKGIGVDIKVCGGQPPYIDAVVFNVSKDNQVNEVWTEMYPLEDMSDKLLGKYEFEEDGDEYVVIVKGV